MTPKEELDQLLQSGPVSDIFVADEARAIIRAIDKGKPEIGQTTFVRVFQTLQGYAIEQVILAVNRMFERPGRFPLRSLPAVVNLLERHAAELVVTEPVLLQQPMTALGLWSKDLEELPERDRTLKIAALLRDRMPTPETHPALHALKTLRDKALAHREHIQAEFIPRTTWEPVEEMVEFAKRVVAAIGGGYLSTGYMMSDGSFTLTYDAQLTSNAVQRLINHLASVDTRRL